jgi:hypothetical protein
MKSYRNAGFSMLQVLVAAGMMSAIALGVARLSQNQGRVIKTGEVKLETTQFFSQVSLMLLSQEVCDNNLKNVNPKEKGTPLSQFVDKNNRPIFKVVTSEGKQSSPGNGSQSTSTTLPLPFDVSKIVVKSKDNFSVLLEVEVTVNGSGIYGSNIKKKEFLIPVVMSGGTISQCDLAASGAIKTAVDEAKKNICEGLKIWNGTACDFDKLKCPSSKYLAQLNGQWQCLSLLESNSQLLECPSSAPVTIAINNKGAIERVCGCTPTCPDPSTLACGTIVDNGCGGSCAPGNQPVAGGWTDWTPTSCELDADGCYTENRYFTRSCSNPTPQCNGSCAGPQMKADPDPTCSQPSGWTGKGGLPCAAK